MNDALQNQIAQTLQILPETANQILLFHGILYTLGLFGVIGAIIYLRRFAPVAKEIRDTGLGLFFIVLLFIAFQLLKISVAGNVYVLEYAATLVK